LLANPAAIITLTKVQPNVECPARDRSALEIQNEDVIFGNNDTPSSWISRLRDGMKVTVTRNGAMVHGVVRTLKSASMVFPLPHGSDVIAPFDYLRIQQKKG
jgi:hypothetical protein